MKALCVYCGSSSGSDPRYEAAAVETGRALAEMGIRLIYGGGNVGLMGRMADACLAAGGEVAGVIPEKLLGLELGHRGVTELHVVEDMHARKAKMAEMSDAFVALPGAIGTLEEIFEVMVWTQLGYHAKPCGLLNVGGYYDHLIAFLKHVVDQRFLREAHLDMLLVETEIRPLIGMLGATKPHFTQKWVD